MKIKYFAWIKERLGKEEEIISVASSMSLEDLIQRLCDIGGGYHEVFSKLEKMCICVNDRLIAQQSLQDVTLSDNDEIAFFPPISGG